MLKNWRMWMLVGLCPLLNGCIVTQVMLFLICFQGLTSRGVPAEQAVNSCDNFFVSADECLRQIALCEIFLGPEECSIPSDCLPLGGSSSFLSEPLFPFPAKNHLPYGEPANFMLSLGNDMAGQPTSLQASFMTAADRLQTHHERFIVPAAFGFFGFTALGAANTQVGTYMITVQLFIGPLSVEVPIRTIDADQAYLDGDDNGGFNADFDSTITHSTDGTGNHLFTILTPFGGDGLPGIQTELANGAVMATLNAGLLTNPATPGTFTLRTELTSIDTDTGGADNGAGETSQQVSMDRDVTIVAVTAIPTVPQWGMIVLTLSLLTLATWQLTGRPALVSVGGTGSVSLPSEPQSWLRSLVLGQIVAGGGLLLYALSGPLSPHDGLGALVAGLLIGTMIEMYRQRGE